MSETRPKIGLALGGGGARGLAHVGILKVLHREGIPVDVITGASFGSIVAAVYAVTQDIDHVCAEVERVLSGDRFHKAKLNFVRHEFEEERRIGLISNLKNFLKKQLFYSVAFRVRQLVSEEEFTSIIDDLIPPIEFHETRIPFACVTTDISHGAEMVIDDGPLRPAVYGSSAIPGVFPPVLYQGRYMVDGGWAHRVPCQPARDLGADIVIGVDISEEFTHEPVEKLKNGLELLIRANNVTGRLLCNLQLAAADVVVRPRVGHLHWASFDRAEFCIHEGERAMEKALPALQAALEGTSGGSGDEGEGGGLLSLFRRKKLPATPASDA
ncbi:MAG: patatin-like phospholipase family protein [Nitrospirota bacterium]|nr:patatin-like phospholipase family protein [Nitrospirota bacterium]